MTKVCDLVPGWLWACAFGLAVLAAGGERMRAQHYKTQIATFKLDAERARADAEKRQREIADQRDKEITEVAKNAQTQINTLRGERDAAVSAADGLRSAATSAARRACPRAAPPGASPGESGPDPLDLLVDVLDRHSRELVEVAGYADGLRIAGTACERAYDAVSR